jgi:hypothetical protein
MCELLYISRLLKLGYMPKRLKYFLFFVDAVFENKAYVFIKGRLVEKNFFALVGIPNLQKILRCMQLA